MKLIYFSRSAHADAINQETNAHTINGEQLVYAPVSASVMEMRDVASSNHQKAALNEIWCNFLLLRDYLGTYILLPHLKARSIKPHPGEWIATGQPIAVCEKVNNSEYRLYIQIQKGVRPYSKHLPFHLSNVLTWTNN